MIAQLKKNRKTCARTWPECLVAVSVLTGIIAADCSAALYDGFNYPRGSYSAENTGNLLWKGTFDIINSDMYYRNVGVLDTSGHMLVVADGSMVTRSTSGELRALVTQAIETGEPLFITFLCTIVPSDGGNGPILHIQDNSGASMLTIGWSNQAFWCSCGSADSERFAHEQVFASDENGYMLSLTIDFGEKNFSARLAVNPMLGMEQANKADVLCESGPVSKTLNPETITIQAPRGTVLYFDELRIGTAPKAVGFKYPDEEMLVISYTKNVAEPTADVDASPLKSIFIIKGNEGTGTGFVVKEGTNIYVYSNLHILTGNRGIKILDNNGTQYSVKRIECASDRDLVRITLKEPPPSFLTIASKHELNEPISVCGNAEGEGVIRPVRGKILGVGPDKIETDAGFVPGHSGSPMVNRANEVVGIASYIRFATTNIVNRDTPFTDTRRIGYRVDNVPGWLPVSPGWFVREAEQLKNHENNIVSALMVLAAWAENPVLAKLPNDDELPHQLNAWIDDHNAWVARNLSRYTEQSLRRGMPQTLAKELLNDIERLESRINVIFAERPPRWHLPRFKEQWDESEKYEQVVSKVIGHIKELCK